jgi:hypothetical protein
MIWAGFRRGDDLRGGAFRHGLRTSMSRARAFSPALVAIFVASSQIRRIKGL